LVPSPSFYETHVSCASMFLHRELQKALNTCHLTLQNTWAQSQPSTVSLSKQHLRRPGPSTSNADIVLSPEHLVWFQRK
jgi:hypothetical protein